MNARIEHVGVWVRDLDAMAAFYARHFGARIGARYENPRKGFASRFLEFTDGARLELMTRGDVTERMPRESLGLAHVAIGLPDTTAVDAMAECLRAAGVSIDDGPRRTGDGYYECVARDPEGNRVEIVAG
jgi:lactoylglutathione lyase